MTFHEFQTESKRICNEEFQGNITSPLEFSLRRAEFVEKRLKALIALAEKTSFQTAQRKKEGWLRELTRVRNNRERITAVHFPKP